MLVGRDAERARIGALLDGARRSRSGVLVVRGEAGVGKSALLEDAREQAHDTRVLRSRGVESEAHLPFAAVHQLVRPVLHHLDELPAPQAAALRGALGLETGGGDERFLVSLAVLSLLADAAEHRPLLCLIDDGHWLDHASADALVFVARRLEAEAIVMLFAAREGEARRFDGPGLPELRLGGLDREAAGALIDRHADVSPEARERLIDGTDGNPLALLELPHALSAAQLAGIEPLLDPLPVTARIEETFRSRVRLLPEDTQALLLVAAAEDTGELATVLRAARHLGAPAEALDAALEAGLVHMHDRQLEFRHPLVRSAIYYAAPPSRRRAAHRALAGALEADSEADRRTWHRAAGSVEPDPTVGEELERAAERALRRSGFAAASLAFERAAALTPGEQDRARRVIAAARSAWFAGRVDRALMLYERARPLATDPIQRADIDHGRGLVEVTRGVAADACRIFVRGAADVAPVDGERALYMLGVGSVAGAYGGDRAALVEMHELVEAMPPAETPVARFLAPYVTGISAYFERDFGRAARELRAAIALADDADAAGAAAFPGLLIVAGAAALFLGEGGIADGFHRRAVARARDTGALALLTQTIPRLALSDIWAGRWSSAAAPLREGLELAREIAQSQVVGHGLAELALIAALRGHEDECRELVAESRELASSRRLLHVANLGRWALTALELGYGRADAAFAVAREMTGLPIPLWAGLDRIEAAARADERELAREWLAEFEAWAEGTGAPWARAVALHCAALLAADEREAEPLFAAALGAHAGSGRSFERARTELAYGEALRRARRRIEAREHLRAALDGFEALGAAPWAERARLELRASGQTARRRDPSTRDELTAQELQIAHLVAQGLTNREIAAQLFLSPRTIEFHLRNVFRKLGIASRTQLARLELEAEGPAISPVPA
jgi:DNA-binding NarL/FixJ family response regulator